MNAWLVVGAAYLLGSLSFSVYIGRLVLRRDIRTVGSGNAGATNVLRAAGKMAGVATLVLDAAKGSAAVLLAEAVDPRPLVIAAAAVAAVLGHAFPIFHGFRGGKGVATGAGVMAVLTPLALLGSLALFIGLVAWTRYVAIGSVVATAGLVPLALLAGWLGWAPWPKLGAVLGGSTISALIVLWHRDNLRRLFRGQEAKIGDPVDLEETDR